MHINYYQFNFLPAASVVIVKSAENYYTFFLLQSLKLVGRKGSMFWLQEP